MATSPSRRDILTSSIALAAGAALPSLGHVSSAMADSSSPTAAEIVTSIRDKKMTAVSAVRAALERAEQLKDLNAFIILNKDGALAAAAQVDAGQKTGALAGLPIVVKDNINTPDMPTRAARQRCKMRGRRKMRRRCRNCWMPAPLSSAKPTCMSSRSGSPAPISRPSQGR
jgi:hypothetical protein